MSTTFTYAAILTGSLKTCDVIKRYVRFHYGLKREIAPFKECKENIFVSSNMASIKATMFEKYDKPNKPIASEG